MKKIKKWWREWAKIDVFGVLGGLILVGGFIIYRNLNPSESSPILDLWPNIATEFLGVWISVRLIDAIIRSREQHHGIRRELVFNLNFIQSEAEHLLPRVSVGKVTTLEQEVKFANERLPKRSQYLDKGEKEKIADVFHELEHLINSSRQYLISQRRAETDSLLIGRIGNELNQKREEVETAIHSVDIDIDEYNNSQISQSVSQIRNFLNSYSSALTKSEIKTIHEYCDEFESIKTEKLSPYRNIRRPKLNRISKYDLEWVRIVEDKFTQIDEWIDFNYEEFYSIIDDSESKVDYEELPQSFADGISNFFNSARNMAEKHNHIRTAVDNLLDKINCAKMDILEETDID